MDSTSGSLPLGKLLVSSDKKTRDKAIKQLATFLSNKPEEPLPKSDLAKLWKGLFYCYWMSDKPLVQQALSSEIAELVLTLSTTAASMSFLRAFWEATVREWNGIDRLRLDKYYMLIRKFTNAAFRLLIRTNWQSDACAEYNDILSTKGGPLCPDDNRVPSSLSYHLADIYLEELDKAAGSNLTCPPVPLSVVLSPFVTLAARTPSNVTYSRLQTSLFEPLSAVLLSETTSSSQRSSEDLGEPMRKRSRTSEHGFQHLIHNARGRVEDASPMTPQRLRGILFRDLFNAASREDARDANRKKLYALWKTAMDGGQDGNVDAS